jgi:DNA-binding transcriptional MerR regulator
MDWQAENIINTFLEPKYTLKDFDTGIITYRTINYWDSSDFLLRKRRKTERGWRRFSLIEFLWIKLLDELRVLNITIESTVPLLFTCLGLKGKTGKEIETAQLNFLNIVKQCVFEKNKLVLLIHKNIAEFKKYDEFKNDYMRPNSFVFISVNKLLIDFIILQQRQEIIETPLLTENENEFLSLLKKDQIAELSIDETKVILDFENNSDTFIRNLIEQFYNPYSKITYKTKGGKTVIIKGVKQKL